MTTSLTSGLPSRLTCTQSLRAAPSRGRCLPCSTRGRARSVEAQTPTTAFARVGAGDRLAVARDVAPRAPAARSSGRCSPRGRPCRRPALPVPLRMLMRVERRAEVDEERVVDLAGEHLAAARQRLDRLRGDGVVVRDRLRPDVVRRDRQVARDASRDRAPCRLLVRLARDGVGLHDVELRVVDRGDAGQRVEERVRVADLGLELEPVADVCVAVAGVVDVQVVARAVVEPVEVRAARRDPRTGSSWRPPSASRARRGA